jgi:tRNA A-37 threonylcarbamoyl transferase component Bud32
VAKFTHIEDRKGLTEDQLLRPRINEAKAAEHAGELGIGPKVYDHYLCRDDGGQKTFVIIMEKLDATLEKWENDARKVGAYQELAKGYRLYIKKVKLLKSSDLAHYDLHPHNIMVKLDNVGSVKDVFIIDWEDTSFKKNLPQNIVEMSDWRMDNEIKKYQNLLDMILKKIAK